LIGPFRTAGTDNGAGYASACDELIEEDGDAVPKGSCRKALVMTANADTRKWMGLLPTR